MLTKIVQVICAISSLLLFLYMELNFSLGYVVSLGTAMLALKYGRWPRSLLVFFLALVQVFLSTYFANKLRTVSYFVALVTSVLIALTNLSSGNDVTVSMRPYEQVIRQHLANNNYHNQLHRVDSWLDNYKGNEKKLWIWVQENYPAGEHHYSSPQRTPTTGGRGAGISSSGGGRPLTTEKHDIGMRVGGISPAPGSAVRPGLGSGLGSGLKAVASPPPLSYREQCYRLMKSNGMLDQARDLFRMYEGRENELLHELEKVIHGTTEREMSLNHQEVVANAFYEASSNIRQRIDAAGQRGQRR